MMNKRLFTLVTALFFFVTTQAQSFETAAEAVGNMGVGWNLGNTLDANNGQPCPDIVRSETMWGQPVTKPELMDMMRQAGFGAIRVPVTWYPHMDNDGNVDPAWMKRVHEVVDYVINAGLYCLLNVHHDTGDGSQWLHASMADYNRNRTRYELLWRQIAEEFRDYGQQLLFESYNEMLDKYNSWCFASFAAPGSYVAADATDAYNAINSYAQSFVTTVRSTGGNNAHRNLVVNTYGACSGSGTWNSHLKDPLKQMKLPNDSEQGHIAFQVHCYVSVNNLANAKNEVNDMFSALKTHLAAKGAPVIIGEWGTANNNEDDYNVRRQNVLDFADYFVKKAVQYGFGTFWWMGISDGSSRSLPAFTQPDLARTILKAYHGDGYTPQLLTNDDYDITYTVNYNGQWQELNLCGHSISLNDYSAVRVELGSIPTNGYLSVKVYGESDGKEQYVSFPQAATATVTFNRNTLGAKSNRITLQYCKSGSYSINVLHAFLIRTDGTEEPATISPFWGCTVDTKATRKPTAVSPVFHTAPASSAVYTLTGRRATTTKKGQIYIKNGKKVLK